MLFDRTEAQLPAQQQAPVSTPTPPSQSQIQQPQQAGQQLPQHTQQPTQATTTQPTSLQPQAQVQSHLIIQQPQLTPQAQVQVQAQQQAQIQAQPQHQTQLQPQSQATQQPALQPIQTQQIAANFQPRLNQPVNSVASSPAFVPRITSTPPLPIAAHQQPGLIQLTLVNRPPTTIPNVPIKNCCLLDNGVRCDKVAGNASFSARIQKIVGTKKLNFSLDPNVRHAYICEHHKAIITVAKKSTPVTKTNARNYAANNNTNSVNAPQVNIPTRQGGAQSSYGTPMDVMMSSGFDNTGGDSVISGPSAVEVDLQQLQFNTLRRYKRHFRVQTRPGLNKMQLAESLKGHFRTLPIIEKEAITYFVYIVKCYRNKLDHNPKAD